MLQSLGVDVQQLKYTLPNITRLPDGTKDYLGQWLVKNNVSPVCIIKLDVPVLCLQDLIKELVFVRCSDVLTQEVNN